MSHSLITHNIPIFMTRFWHANCMAKLRDHHMPLIFLNVQWVESAVLQTAMVIMTMIRRKRFSAFAKTKKKEKND